MKKNIKTNCLLVLLICMLSTTYGQNAIGGKIGLNIATFIGDTDEFQDKGFVFVFQLGGIFEHEINDLISIQPELLYIRKGVNNEFLGFAGEGQTDFILNYIEVPLLVKYKYGVRESTNFFITGGPTFGFLATAKTESRLFIGGETVEESEDIDFGDEDSFRRFEIGVSLGIGASVPLGPGKFFGEARLSIGITDLNSNDLSDLTTRNAALGLTVGYLYSLGN